MLIVGTLRPQVVKVPMPVAGVGRVAETEPLRPPSPSSSTYMRRAFRRAARPGLATVRDVHRAASARCPIGRRPSALIGATAQIQVARLVTGNARRFPLRTTFWRRTSRGAWVLISTPKLTNIVTRVSCLLGFAEDEQPPMPTASGSRKDLRRTFAARLKAARAALGYTQEEMAYALGIQKARYSKYEIGRSEAPYDVLVKIAQLANVDLDYLIAGRIGRRGRRPEPPNEQLHELLQSLPTAAVVYDAYNTVLLYNSSYRAHFFPDQPRLLRRGTPQEVLVRGWAYAQGCSQAEVEDLVRKRLNPGRSANFPVEIRVGSKWLHIAETIEPNRRLVLVTDVTEFRTGRS